MLANYNAIEDSGGYVIERSLRFMSASSQYLSRTPAGVGNRKTWTLSTWVERGKLGVTQGIFEGFASSTNITSLSFGAGDTINLQLYTNPTYNTVWQTTKVFRDPSAHYHIVLKFDTTQASMNDMMRLYVNGELQTFNYTNYNNAIPQNSDWFVNSTSSQLIGSYVAANFLDGYLSEINFIDGQALTPSSFGETNTTTGQWVAKKYTGTYGTNGFYLDFKDGTSTTTLGYDKSGNGNNWTLTNFTRSAGVNDCWMLDTPSNNFAVLNPLDAGASFTPSGANLTCVLGSSLSRTTRSGFGVTSGKWYFETIPSGSSISAGVVRQNSSLATWIGGDANGWGYYGASGEKYTNGVPTAYGNSYTTNDVIGCAVDMDTGKIWFSKNGVWQASGDPEAGTNEAYSGITGEIFPAVSYVNLTGTVHINCGQRSFAYTPPTGFKALCTANLTSTDVIESGSFTGNSSADGRHVWCNGTPETLTINGNAVTWGTHADKLANGFKLRTSSSSYNSSGTNTWTATILSPESKSAFKHQNAKGN